MDHIDRKQFLSRSVKAAFGTLILGPTLLHASGCAATAQTAATPPLPAPDNGLDLARIRLPYGYDALEPHIDARTMELHYSKHHAAYEQKAQEAMKEENITAASATAFFAGMGRYSAKARNNGGGVWNHNFFWKGMRPGAGGTPTGRVQDAISGAFGSFDKFKEEYNKAAMGRFGSGWAWLVERNGKLEIGSTANQDNPLMDVSDFRGKPLLGLDVWEHAYYLKYQNKRADYVEAWWNVVDWDEVARQLGS
jgi:superoxide dismutase, Fe-Mn family